MSDARRSRERDRPAERVVLRHRVTLAKWCGLEVEMERDGGTCDLVMLFPA
jgi:hypothetical protein